MNRTTSRTPAAERRGTQGFTITELLVVISIIVLLIAIAVPAFSNLMSSSERSLAENQFRAGLAAGRDVAIQSGFGDGAAVFVAMPNGRTAIVPCVVVGQIEDLDDPNQAPSATNLTRLRDVLVPVAGFAPMQLPRGWTVSAFAPANTAYDPPPNGSQAEPWYAMYDTNGTVSARPADAPWVSPETLYYDTTAGPLGQAPPAGLSKTGATRESFMVRFKVGTGALDVGDHSTALVFDPVLDTDFRSRAPLDSYRSDQLRFPGTPPVIAPNAAAYVRRLLGNRSDAAMSGANARKNLCAVLGDISYDTILVRPVTELALYEQVKLAAGIGAGALNRDTQTLYANAKVPTIDSTLFAGNNLTQAVLNKRISQWIEGRYSVNGQPPYKPTGARIFTMQRYLGQIQEVAP